MTQVKTQIWRGGLPGVTPPDKSAGKSTRVTMAPTPDEAAPPAEAEPTVVRRPPSPLQTTRIMPVEELLGQSQLAPSEGSAAAEPGRAGDAGKAEAASPEANAEPEQQLGLSPKKRSLRPLMAVLAALTLAMWLVPLLRGTDAARPPSPVKEKAAQRVEQTSAGRGEAVVALTPVPARSTAPEGRGRGGRTEQRGAADALASGDYALAAQLYESLAESHPEQPAYAQAARVLTQRAEGPR